MSSGRSPRMGRPERPPTSGLAREIPRKEESQPKNPLTPPPENTPGKRISLRGVPPTIRLELDDIGPAPPAFPSPKLKAVTAPAHSRSVSSSIEARTAARRAVAAEDADGEEGEVFEGDTEDVEEVETESVEPEKETEKVPAPEPSTVSKVEPFIVKALLGEELRRFKYDSVCFALLKSKLCQIFSLKDVIVMYKDDEDDLITVSSDDELQEAIELLEPKTPFRLYLKERASANGSQRAKAAAPVAEQDSFSRRRHSSNTLLQKLEECSSSPQPAPELASRRRLSGGEPSSHASEKAIRIRAVSPKLTRTSKSSATVSSPALLTVPKGEHSHKRRGGSRSRSRSRSPSPSRALSPRSRRARSPKRHSRDPLLYPNSVLKYAPKPRLPKSHFKPPNVFPYAAYVPPQHRPDYRPSYMKKSRAPTSHPTKKQEPKYVARFVKDVTFGDDSVVAPNSKFVKTWRLRNDGTNAWPVGSELRLLNCDRLESPDSVPVVTEDKPVEPGAEVDVSVPLSAPAEPGRYRGYWRMRLPNGRKFGQRLWTTVQVVDQDKEAKVIDPGQYAVQLEEIEKQGFHDRRKSLQYLEKYNGDLGRCIRRLSKRRQQKLAAKGRLSY